MAELNIKAVAHDVTGGAASAALEFQTKNCLWENVQRTLVCKEHWRSIVLVKSYPFHL